MSDARMQAARQMMDTGDLQGAMALLKTMLQERPEDGEVRQALMELQELMMLDMQLQEKLRRVRGLAAEGNADGARNLLNEVLKVSPHHRDALALQAELSGAAPGAGGEFDFGELPPAGGLELGAPAAGGAEATEFDFGELPEAPGFEAPPATPVLPEPGTGGEFDFGELPPAPAGFELAAPPAPAQAAPGAPGLSPQEQAKVQQYLADGKALLAQGKTQDAIDVWTRVFILDEENAEAQALIDQARASLNANQGELDYTLNEGIAAFNAGDFARAKPLLEKVLGLSPGHREAQYYFSRLPAEAPAAPAAPAFELEGDFSVPAAPAPAPAPAFTAPRPAAPAAAPAIADDGGFELETGAADDFAPSAPAHAAPAPPPPPVAAAPVGPPPQATGSFKRPPAPAPKKKGPSLGLILGGAAGLLLIGAAIFFVPKLLGGGTPPPPPTKAPGDPKPIKKPEAQPAVPITVQPVVPQGKEELLKAAKEAMAAGKHQQSVDFYRQVLGLDPLNPEAQSGLEQARAAYQRQLEEEARNAKFLKDYQSSVKSYRDGDYAEALRLAWRLVYPDDTLAKQLGKANSVRLLLRNGYYNWAVRDLKSENPRGAEKNLRDLLDADANDGEAKRLLEFTRKYVGRPVDAGYRDTVAALTYRPFEEVP